MGKRKVPHRIEHLKVQAQIDSLKAYAVRLKVRKDYVYAVSCFNIWRIKLESARKFLLNFNNGLFPNKVRVSSLYDYTLTFTGWRQSYFKLSGTRFLGENTLTEDSRSGGAFYIGCKIITLEQLRELKAEIDALE